MHMLERIPWDAARDLLLSRVGTTRQELVALDSCFSRILAVDLAADEDVPSFDRSAYDGYALRSQDVAGASREHPATLKITETIPAGTVPSMDVVSGTAAHLMTGSPIPRGADCVINFEATRFTEETVTLFQSLKPGANIVKKGEDVRAGTVLAPCGTCIDAGLAGTLAAQGIVQVPVFRRPRIGLISTGSEVVEAETVPAPGQSRNSSRSSFTALLEHEGCDVSYLGLCPDDASAIAGCIRKGLADCDAVLLTGGVSVGDWDLTPQAMETAGVDILLSGVDMKPGMACVYGFYGQIPVLGLSGNPASALTNFCACVLPSIRRLCGKSRVLPDEIQAECAEGFSKKSPSARFLRGRLSLDTGRAVFHTAAGQGNVMLASMIGCNAFCVIPAGSGPVQPGQLLSGFLM